MLHQLLFGTDYRIFVVTPDGVTVHLNESEPEAKCLISVNRKPALKLWTMRGREGNPTKLFISAPRFATDEFRFINHGRNLDRLTSVWTEGKAVLVEVRPELDSFLGIAIEIITEGETLRLIAGKLDDRIALRCSSDPAIRAAFAAEGWQLENLSPLVRAVLERIAALPKAAETGLTASAAADRLFRTPGFDAEVVSHVLTAEGYSADVIQAVMSNR